MDLFADRLGNVTIANGVVRMDFLRIKEAEQQQAHLEHAFRVAMSMDGILQAIAVLEQVKQELVLQTGQDKIKSQ